MSIRSIGRVLRILLLLDIMLLVPWDAGATEEVAGDIGVGDSGVVEDFIDRAVKRFDPGRRALVPVQKPIPEKIYNHYSDKLKRRVWAFARPDGNFSHALGEGSTQSTKQFDFPYSTAQQQEMVAQVAPRWARAMQQVGAEVFVRLDREQSWKLVQHLTIPSIYDLETGRRWEWHGNRRVAVGHTTGYRWRMVDGRYQPENYYPYGMASAPMGCERCGRVGNAY